jgi:hypothetical protein
LYGPIAAESPPTKKPAAKAAAPPATDIAPKKKDVLTAKGDAAKK